MIVNPRSAGGSTSERWSSIASDIRSNFGPFAVEFTLDSGDGARIAEEAARAGRRFIIACGGDGTINEVANGILRSRIDAELGILPSGTGGDLRRSVGMPRSISEAALALRDGVTKTIDVGRVTFIDNSGAEATRYFLNISSVGLAPSVISRVKRSKSLDWLPAGSVKGKANFALSTLREVIDPEAVFVRVNIDGVREKKLETICLCIANARFFGGGMMVAPNAKMTDGLLDVVNIGDLSTFKILLNAISLYRGKHLSLDEVKTTRVQSITVEADDSNKLIPIEIDGELLGRLPASYQVVPNSLKIRVPNHDRR